MNKKIIIMLFFLVLLPLFLFSETVYFVPKIDKTEMVNLPYANYILRSIKQAEEANADYLIIEMNTFGGRVDAAIKITDALLSSKLKTVVYINKDAISAGALISLAAQKIYIASGGVIGASTPVIQKGKKMETASEKSISVMRAKMRSSAEKYNRSATIAEAMVDPDIILTKKINGISLKKGKLLTLTAKEAYRLRIVNGRVENFEDVIKKLKLKNPQIVTTKLTSSDEALFFLSNPVLIGILLTLGTLGLIFEVKSPGWGVGGTIGILCLALFFIVQIFTGYAAWGEIALLIVGCILIALEIFLIPGFGLVGISGILAIIAGFLMWYSKWSKDTQFSEIVIISVIFFVILGIYVMFKYLPRSKLFNRLVLDTSETKQEGFHASLHELKLEGTTGITKTKLRPAGKAEINKKMMDVMSNGDFINKGEKIKVVKIEGNRILVKKIS